MMRARVFWVAASRCMPNVSTPAAFIRWNQIGSRGRLALRLDRQIDRGLDGKRAFRQHGGAAVDHVRRPSRQHHVLHTIQQYGHAGDFGQLLRRFVGDRAAGFQRLADCTELACRSTVSVADAGLQHGRRQHVPPVQQCNLPIRNTIKRLQPVEPRRAREADPADRFAIAQERADATRVRVPPP